MKRDSITITCEYVKLPLPLRIHCKADVGLAFRNRGKLESRVNLLSLSHMALCYILHRSQNWL